MAQESDRTTGRRVGALAAAAGLTVRTLHYYEEIGLLVARRSEAGHRLYDDADVERLYRICLLRRLGFALDEIGRALDDPAWSIRSAMAAHLSDLDGRIDRESRLRARLAQLTASMGDADGPLTPDLLDVLEAMTMLDTTVQRRISILVYRDPRGGARLPRARVRPRPRPAHPRRRRAGRPR